MNCLKCGAPLNSAGQCGGCYPSYTLTPFGQAGRYGWICPRCNQVKSPDVQTCHCQLSVTLGNPLPSVPHPTERMDGQHEQ